MRISSSRDGRRGKPRSAGALAARTAAVVVTAMALAGRAEASADALARLDGEIESWRLTEADRALTGLDPSEQKTPEADYLRGKLHFYRGEYDTALTWFRKAIEGARAEIDWKALRDRASETQEAFARLARQPDQSGRFVYRYEKGVDALLLPYADEALKRQMAVLTELFGDAPDFPVEIDILPDVATLARASGLSEEQIDRTGTVGVTKYGRVMIVSPRALLTGYPWIDTLAHELTHLVVTRVSGNRAPVWLQEGVAKLLETQWRGEGKGVLSPEEAYLLDRASREGRLIPLQRFHPSVAYLPDQEDAALAYAQALSLVGYLNDRLGPDWMKKLFAMLSDGQTLDQGIADLAKHPFPRLYQWWKQSVSGRRQTPVPSVYLMQRRFKRGKATGESGLESLLGDEVRRHLRLGDLLRLRGHVDAAAKEYGRAESLADSPSPRISDRLAACLLELGETEKVIAMLPSMAALYPAHSTIFIQLGTAQARENRTEEAARNLELANAINPLHPAVHCGLKDLYAKLGRGDRAKQEAENCLLLAAHPEETAESETP